MRAPRLARLALSPPAELTKLDTGLRFTDILFGFVIRELFLRLQHWSDLTWFVRWQLIAGTALVLGSWIGFRRSLNRTTYELKFFNLPLFRFVLDQLMVILYFRIATLTPQDIGTTPPMPPVLAKDTAFILLLIFGLYAAWDVGALAMGIAPKYTDSKPDLKGFTITLAMLMGFLGLWAYAHSHHLARSGAERAFVAATILLLVYRFLKEIRSSARTPEPHPPASAA